MNPQLAVVKKVPNVMCVDVDGTLLLWTPKPGRVPRPGEDGHGVEPKINLRVVELMLERKRQGWQIIVWSYGGKEHAQLAVEFAKLQHVVDACIGKPTVMIDDAHKWLDRVQRLDP